MKVVLLPVLLLSLAVVGYVGYSAYNAESQTKTAKTDANEAFDINELFPLAKPNGVALSVLELPSANKNIVRKDIVPTFLAGQAAFDNVVAHPETATAIQLGVAADMAYRSGDLPEAAFLFYAARLRLYHDLEKFPPKESGADQTQSFLRAVTEGVQIDLLRELYLHPKALAEVVRRIESFPIQEPAGYQPGWAYTTHDVARDWFAKNKAVMVRNMKPMAELLAIPEYFEAFRTMRECNDLPFDRQEDKAVVDRRTKAEATMTRIEKEKNLRGVMYQMNNASSE